MKNGSTNRLGFVLTAINLVALSYPIMLLHRAETIDAYLFAIFVLIGCVFLLTVIDFVSIVIVDGLDEHNAKQQPSSVWAEKAANLEASESNHGNTKQ